MRRPYLACAARRGERFLAVWSRLAHHLINRDPRAPVHGCRPGAPQMRLRANVIANYLGQGWTALMSLLFVPVYIHLLGIEAYGLIGFFAALQLWLTLLDLGILPTSVREMARFTSGAVTTEQIRDLLRSFELICLVIGLAVAATLWATANPIGRNWLNAEHIPPSAVAQSVALMGLVLAARLGEGLYRSCLVGLQRQVWLNAASAALATLRSVGAVAILYEVDQSIQAYFVWQAVISILSVAVLGIAVHRTIPSGERPAHFSRAALASVGRFAGGMLGINFLAVLLTQVDKLLLSRLLPLDQYGYYMLATAATALLLVFTSPITQAIFPVMVEDIGRGAEEKVTSTFHHGAQLITAITAPMAFALMFFSDRILFAWTGDAALTDATAPLLSLLAAGSMVNGFMQLPYYLQVAHGWTSLALRMNIAAVIVLIPALLWLVPIWGGAAAAAIWLTLNLCYLTISAPIMFHWIQKGELWRWYLRDLAMPASAAAAVLLLARLIPLDQGIGRVAQAAFVISAAGLAFAAAALTVDGMTANVRQAVRRLQGSR